MSGGVVLAATTTGRGGVWRHVEDLAIGLAERGWRVVLGLRADAIELRAHAARLGFDVEELSGSASRRCDIWHAHLHDTYELAALDLLARRRRQGPAILTEHLPRTNASDPGLLAGDRHRPGADQARAIFKCLEYSLTSQIIAVGASSATFLKGRYGLSPGDVTVVQNGVRAGDGVPASPVRAGALRVLVPGSLIVQKGHDVLIEAARHAKEDWTVTVIGDGPHRSSLEARARDVDGRVTFLGWRDDAIELMQAAQVVCLPSRWESFPYAALEAMAQAKPVVASRVDGLDEIVVNGVTGIQVVPENPVALARALDDCSRLPSVRLERLGRAGRERVATLYEVDGMVSKTESIYRRQIDSWRDRAGADGSTISRFVGYWRRASASADGSARASRRKD